MMPIIRGLATLASDEEFLALEMDSASRVFSMTHFTVEGERLSSFKLPINTARKMVVSGDDRIVVILQQDRLDAVYLDTGALKSWKFLKAERLFSVESGIIAQSDDGNMTFISSDLAMIGLEQRPEIVAMSLDQGILVERFSSQYLTFTRKGLFKVNHTPAGKYVLTSLCGNPLIWLAESGSVLRAFDDKNGGQLFQVMPKDGWHFDLLSPTRSQSSILAKAINFETGSHMNIFLLSWQNGRLNCDLRAQFAISPPHCIFTSKGSFLVSGTREIFDSLSGRLIGCF